VRGVSGLFPAPAGDVLDVSEGIPGLPKECAQACPPNDPSVPYAVCSSSFIYSNECEMECFGDSIDTNTCCAKTALESGLIQFYCGGCSLASACNDIVCDNSDFQCPGEDPAPPRSAPAPSPAPSDLKVDLEVAISWASYLKGPEESPVHFDLLMKASAVSANTGADADLPDNWTIGVDGFNITLSGPVSVDLVEPGLADVQGVGSSLVSASYVELNSTFQAVSRVFLAQPALGASLCLDESSSFQFADGAAPSAFVAPSPCSPVPEMMLEFEAEFMPVSGDELESLPKANSDIAQYVEYLASLDVSPDLVSLYFLRVGLRFAHVNQTVLGCQLAHSPVDAGPCYGQSCDINSIIEDFSPLVASKSGALEGEALFSTVVSTGGNKNAQPPTDGIVVGLTPSANVVGNPDADAPPNESGVLLDFIFSSLHIGSTFCLQEATIYGLTSNKGSTSLHTYYGSPAFQLAQDAQPYCIEIQKPGSVPDCSISGDFNQDGTRDVLDVIEMNEKIIEPQSDCIVSSNVPACCLLRCVSHRRHGYDARRNGLSQLPVRSGDTYRDGVLNLLDLVSLINLIFELEG